ncbi:MAG: 3-oxoacyl-[acyl-carrier-protein] reductase [Chloroflexia bacterium]
MAGRLEGQVALVTGASRGIGRATALALAREGAAVVVNFREQAEAAAEVVRAVAEAGGRAQALQADVTDARAVRRMVDEALAVYGHIDILVNNAGISRDRVMLQMREDDWRAVLETNLTAAFLCSRAVLRPMIRQGYGRIVNVSSVAGLVGNVGQANYAAAKAGLIGLTKTMARELAAHGITVNAVAPTYVEGTTLFSTVPRQVREWALTIIPMKRFARPEEVAAAIVFLASPEASYITGHVLVVDGGMTCP